MFRLDGKVALVTGGARGIGAAIARAMVAEGAKVVIGDLLDGEGEALANELGASATYAHLDVTKRDDWETAVATAVKVYGKLNVLVNNAGIGAYAPIEQYSNADWDRIIAINLTGVFNGIKAAIPSLKDARGGSIVNISSMAGLRGEAGMSGYVATKWAVRGLTKSAALELARYGIRVNSIHPGVVRTPLSAEGPQVSMSHVAMNRVGEPIEIANLAVFLTSDESSFSTGAEFIADGGETAGLIRHVGSPAEHAVSTVEVPSRQFRIRRFAKWSADLRYRKAIVDRYTQMVFTRRLNGWGCGTKSRLSAVHSFSRRQTFGTQFVRTARYKGFIYAIAQTPDGYLWLGTEFGLLRFDGVRAVPWMPPNGQLPSNDIPTLLVTRDGTFWIGTTNGLASWKDGKLTTYSPLNGSRIFALLEDRDGTVWAATREPRIFGENVGPIDADAEGNFWVGFDKDSRKWKSGRPQSFEVRDSMHSQAELAELEQFAFPTTNHKRLTKSVAAQFERGASTVLSQHLKPQQILRDRDGALWVAIPDRGLVHIHQGKTDVFSEADGLSGDTVTGLLEDREGVVWAVTSNGIDRFREYAVPNISIKQGLSSTRGVAIVGAKDGSVWVATYNGLNRWKDGRISVVNRIGSTQDPNRTPKGAPYSLFEDSERRIWLSTVQEFGYLENNRFVPVRDVHGGRITSMAEGSSGHLWLAKEEEGLLHLFQGRVVEKFPWTALGHHDDGRVVLADPSQHGIWLGFRAGGISYFADGAIRKSYSVAEGLGAGMVNGLRFGPRGALWAATENGLSRIKDDHVTTLTSKNGLPCDNVHWTVDDTGHFVWVYTACGLVRIARTELDAWVDDPSRSVAATLFDASDGVRTQSNPSAVQGVSKASDGRIWYVSLDVVSVIDPQHFPFNKHPPPVNIEQVTADRKTYDAAQGLRLPPLVRDLAIDYTALSFVAPEQVKFRYKLEGYDNEWQDAGNRRQAIYTNLPPHAYRFRLMASNNSGVWNEEGALLDFSIAPAFYQTTWFRLGILVLFLFLLWAAYQLRVRQLAHQFNMTLEARVGERTRIARELHDTLLQSFQGLLLRFQSVAKLLPERPDDARQRLDSAIQQAAEAVTEGRDAVQGLRSSAFETNDLANAIAAIAEELTKDTAAGESPVIDLEVEGAPRGLNPVVRDEAYRIACEALRNAFRHAQARRITVEIRYDKRDFRLRVRDDGKGIDGNTMQHQSSGHFGLPGMRERAAIIGGRLEVWSKLDSGTEIELIISDNIAYGESAQRSWFSRVLPGNRRDHGNTEP